MKHNYVKLKYDVRHESFVHLVAKGCPTTYEWKLGSKYKKPLQDFSDATRALLMKRGVKLQTCDFIKTSPQALT